MSSPGVPYPGGIHIFSPLAACGKVSPAQQAMCLHVDVSKAGRIVLMSFCDSSHVICLCALQ